MKDLTLSTAIAFKNKDSLVQSVQKYCDKNFSPFRVHLEERRIRFKCPKGHKNVRKPPEKDRVRTTETVLYDQCKVELVYIPRDDGSWYLFSRNSSCPTHIHTTSEKEYYEYPYIRKRMGMTNPKDIKVINYHQKGKVNTKAFY